MKICLHRESNLRLLDFQTGALDQLPMLTVIELWFKLLHYFKLWINSTRVTMHVWNWLWLDVYWNWRSDILFISYVYQCWFYLLLITVFRMSKLNPNHALFKHWIAFFRCSRAIWIASEKIAKKNWLSFRGNSYCPWKATKCDSIFIFTSSFNNKGCRDIVYLNTKMSYLSDFKRTKSKTLRTASWRMTHWTKLPCDQVQMIRTKDWYFLSLIIVNTATSYFLTNLHEMDIGIGVSMYNFIPSK